MSYEKSEITEIYNNILKGYTYIKNKIIYKKITTFNLKKLDLKEISGVPKEIQLYIKENMNQIITYKVNINGKSIVLNFYTDTDKYSNTPNTKDLYKTFIVIYLLTLYSSKRCSKQLKIDIYLTPFKRMLPKKNDIIEPINVNGGYTYEGCKHSNKITVYRFI